MYIYIYITHVIIDIITGVINSHSLSSIPTYVWLRLSATAIYV